jgi:hypothetical protein
MKCVVCDKEYQPEPGIEANRVYCSPKCAWSSAPRSEESMRRELAALEVLLSQESPCPSPE